jgi:hypothetical protein
LKPKEELKEYENRVAMMMEKEENLPATVFDTQPWFQLGKTSPIEIEQVPEFFSG